MVDLEPFLEAPFEEASNLSFEALLLIGIGLLAAVAALGRSTVTIALVVLYLLSIPGYIGFRAHVWSREARTEDDETADGDDDSGDSDDDTSDGVDEDDADTIEFDDAEPRGSDDDTEPSESDGDTVTEENDIDD